ncbi:MAG TPA: aminotransferase class I/II-fold pyridoxal phosphate-dependent enzyme [Myxococcaceae bacterium]|nr:aminotransferase class I/II-fold pyridoxal phosphate-dependent enzyme [Myxococcaceae bacterium]
MAERRKRLETIAIHAGTRLEGSRSVPVVSPVHVSAVSYFDSAEELDRSLDGQDFVYSRINAQSAWLLEQAVAALEGAEDCAAYASGMAALKAVLDAQEFKSGDRAVMTSDGYGATRLLYKTELAARGVELVAIPLCAAEAPGRIRELRPRFVLAESVTNPLLSVADVPALAEACRDVGASLAVDATFPSPILQRPLALGADYSIHSTTKWINGHSDATGGVVSGNRARLAALKKARISTGAILGPFEAWLTLRGVRTLPVRMRAHSHNAMRIAERLADSDLLERVYYPGLPGDPNHAVARRMLEGGFGGMIAFEIRGADRSRCFRFLEVVRLAKPAPSLGDVTTLVMHAASASARRMTPDERAAAGIRENLIRVSVGLEDPDDIADDLLEAVEKAMGARP